MNPVRSILVTFCLLLAGCRPSVSEGDPDTLRKAAGTQATSTAQQEPETSSNAGHRAAQSSPAESSAEPAAIPLAPLGIERQADDDALDDPAWEIEGESQRLQSSLNELGAALHDPSKMTASAIDAWAAQDFRTTPLRPERLTLVASDATIEVRRSADRLPTAAGGPAGAGAAAGRSFSDALVEALGRLHDAHDVHAKFKLYSIHRNDERLETMVDVTFSGPVADEHLQISEVWTCWWSRESDTYRLSEIRLDDYEEVSAKTDARFVDVTRQVMASVPAYDAQLAHGMDYWLDRLENQFGIIPAGYHGVSVGDVNGDELEDVFIPQPGGLLAGLPNRLLLQQPDGTLRDVSAEAGLDWTVETHSALLIDLDNDGDQDIVVATVQGVVFAENDGQGRFRARLAKLTPEAPPMSLAAADFDNDADLDVYVCCYSQRATSPLMGRPIPYHDANNGGRNLLFRNDRQWRFRNVTRQVGLDQNNRRFSFAAAWEDYDNDGDLDLYVANDYGRNNLYQNRQGQFADVAGEMGVEDISAGMSISWGDYNRDGWMDIYVGNMWSSAGQRISYQRRFQSMANPETLSSFQRHARGNTLFANHGSQQSAGFEDVSQTAAVSLGRWAWASLFTDLNNDGWEDIVVANGFITQEDTHDL
jgi:hypothetical protein